MTREQQHKCFVNFETLVRCLSTDLGPRKTDFFRSDMSVEDADMHSFRGAILSKYEGITTSDATQRAIQGFIADNDRCARFRIDPQRIEDDYIIGGVKLFLEKWLHDRDGCPPTLTSLTDLSKCGPGSSVDVDLPSFYTKLFDSTLATANPELRLLYRTVVSQNPVWFAAEEWREHIHGSRTVLGSTLSTVRKKFDIDRTICTEPPLEMFFQLGIGGFLESSVLKRLGINLSTQPDKNRELARIGSLDGSIATIDLRSASNSITRQLVEMAPKAFVNWLYRSRSPKTRLPNGEWIDLHMVASMGNGYCFPLQTMLFASIVASCYDLLGIEVNFGSAKPEGYLSALEDWPRVNAGVFGDDICVRREAYHMVVRGLTLFGFQVNEEKSHHVGPFRESCGHDYFRGVNIRGVYLKKLTTRSDCYSLINRLIRWTTRTGYTLDYTLSYLLRAVGYHPIPFVDGDDEGVKVPFKWHSIGPWQPREWYALGTGSQLYWRVKFAAEKIRVSTYFGDSHATRGDYTFGFNADGIVIALCGGYIRGGYLHLRGDRDDGTSSRCPEVLLWSIPYWDYRPKAAEVVDLRGRSWEAAVDRVMALAFPRLGTF